MFLPVFLFRMTLFLLMYNTYIFSFVLLLFLKPSFKLTTIHYFFSSIENYIKRRRDLLTHIDGNLISCKKKFDGGTLLDENRPVRRLRRNRGSTCWSITKAPSSHNVDNRRPTRRRPLSQWASLSGNQARRASFASCDNFYIRPSALSGRSFSSVKKSRLVF